MDLDTFGIMNNWIMRPAGFACSAGAWTKQLTAPEYAALEALVDTLSEEKEEWTYEQLTGAVERKVARLQDCCYVGMPLKDYQPSAEYLLGSKEAVDRWNYFHDNYDFSCGMYGASYPAL